MPLPGRPTVKPTRTTKERKVSVSAKKPTQLRQCVAKNRTSVAGDEDDEEDEDESGDEDDEDDEEPPSPSDVTPLALDREAQMTPEQLFADFYRRYGVKPGTKIFVIWGKCYDNVRQALLKRGWFENPVKHSKAFHFKWTLKLDDVEEGFDDLREDQIVNHYRRSYELISKHGLARNMRALSAFEDVDIDQLMPRSFYIYDINQFREFLNDYALSTARAKLDLFVGRGKGPAPSCNAARVAVTVCQRFARNFELSLAATRETRAGTAGESHNKSIAWEARTRALQMDPPLLESHIEWVALYGKKKASGRFPKCVQNIMTEQAVVQGKEELELAVGAPSAELSEEEALEIIAQIDELLPQSCIDCRPNTNMWIVKSVGLSRGRGLKVMNDLGEMLEYCRKKKFRAIVQKYIESPLLVHQFKFDLRQWVVVTSWNPLIVWMYSEFYVRLGSYEYDAEDLSNKVHLTNNSVQKKTENYNKHDFCSHAMWDYETLKAYVAELQGVDEEAAENTWTTMMHQMEKIVINSLKAMCDVCEGRDKSFELYGYDFMIDNSYRPWILEVNSSPDMSKTAPVQRKMVIEAVDDMMDVVQYGTNPNRLKKIGKERDADTSRCRWRLIHRGKPIPEKQIHRRFWLKKAEIDRHNAPRGPLNHHHHLRNWLLGVDESAAAGEDEQPTASKSAAAIWHATAKKTILQKNLEQAHLAAEPKPAQPAKRIGKAAASVMAKRLSKPRDPPLKKVAPKQPVFVGMAPRGQAVKQQVFSLDCDMFGA